MYYRGRSLSILAKIGIQNGRFFPPFANFPHFSPPFPTYSNFSPLFSNFSPFFPSFPQFSPLFPHFFPLFATFHHFSPLCTTFPHFFPLFTTFSLLFPTFWFRSLHSLLCVFPPGYWSGVLIYVVNLIYFIDLDLIKIVMWCEIDRLHVLVCLDILYCSLSKVYWGIIIMQCVKYGYLKLKLQI